MTYPRSRPASARLRRGRTSESGRIYLITFTTFERRRIFADWHTARTAAAQLSRVDLWQESRLLCWVLMPDHWHGLIEFGGNDSLSQRVRRIKGACARAINLAKGSSGPIWMGGFHDHALRQDEELLPTARYVILNPVRAGLVPRVGLYPFWNAIWLEVGEEHRG